MSIRKTIILKGTMKCNLKCMYCYELRLHDSVRFQHSISPDAVAKFIEKCAVLFPKSEILWLLHGGEPMLCGVDFFETVAQAVRRSNDAYGVNFRMAVQTNGTLISDDWIDVFSRNMDVFSERIISVSIDGPQWIDCIARVNSAGNPAYDRVLSSFHRIRSSNMDFTTISVVGQHNVHAVEETYNFIKSLNPNFSKFIPCYNMDSQGNTESFGITPIEYSHFMCGIFNMWLSDLPNRTDKKFVIDPILSIISKLTNSPVTWCEYRTEKCDNFMSMYPNGELWLCDAYDHSDMRTETFIGNAFLLNDDDIKRIFSKPTEVCSYHSFYQKLMVECLECEVYRYCCGGCLEKRYSMKRKSNNRYQEFCEGKKILINHIKGAIESACS